MQAQNSPDWGEGLPPDLLALVAKHSDGLKAMRGVRKSWEKGFDLSISSLHISIDGPPLPLDGTFPQRFPSLNRMSLGESPIAEADLAQLAALKHLLFLNLGKHPFHDLRTRQRLVGPDVDCSGSLFARLTGAGLQHLRGLQLVQLGLHHCEKLTDEDLESLQGQPLTFLELPGCIGLKGPGLRHLQGMPLASLDLGGCQQLRGSDFASLRGLPLTSLDVSYCVFDGGDDLRFLVGLPLTFLSLEGCTDWVDDVDLEYLRGAPLTSLNLNRCSPLNGSGLECAQNAPLRTLKISYSTVRGCHVGFSKPPGGWPIKELEARGMWKFVLCQVSYMPGLTSLDWSENGSDLDFFWGEDEHDLPIPPLKTLKLENNNVTDDDLENLVGLPLTELDLKGSTRLTRASLEFITSLNELAIFTLPDHSQMWLDIAEELKGVFENLQCL